MFSIDKTMVGTLECTLITVEQENIKATFIDYGAAIHSISVPDQFGTMECVLLTYESLESYIENKRHLNATIGPTAGRIQNAEFTIGTKTHHIDKNLNHIHNLHGGKDALSYTMFDYEIVEEKNQTEIVFKTRKKAGEQLYPGTQQYTVIYTVTDSTVTIEFIAETDYPTVVNLTNHAYFNLSGNLQSTILQHEMKIAAKKALKLDEEMIPYQVVDIQQTALDYTSLRPIKGPDFTGIDDPYILDEVTIERPQATLIDPVSKRRLDVYTTYPSIVCYTDNFPMDVPLAYNAINQLHMGVCFEAQNPPNGIHIQGLESSILHPDEGYYHKTIFAFRVEV